MKKQNTHVCDAEVTIKFLVENICSSEDIDEGDSLFYLVEELLDREGIYNFLTEEEYEIIEVKEI